MTHMGRIGGQYRTPPTPRDYLILRCIGIGLVAVIALALWVLL